MNSVSDIKLIRTDTTLDLSQKAEKRYPKMPAVRGVVEGSLPRDMVVVNTSPPEALARAIRATPYHSSSWLLPVILNTCMNVSHATPKHL